MLEVVRSAHSHVNKAEKYSGIVSLLRRGTAVRHESLSDFQAWRIVGLSLDYVAWARGYAICICLVLTSFHHSFSLLRAIPSLPPRCPFSGTEF